MKIIAKTTKGFLLEASEYEIANIAGESWPAGLKRPMECGVTIEVSKAWKDLCQFRDASVKITEAAESLRACALLAEKTAADYIVAPPEPEAAVVPPPPSPESIPSF